MIEVDNAKALNKEISKNHKLVVLFYSSWCPFCIRFVPVFDKIIAEYKVGAVLHVLLEDDDNPLWVDYDIEAVPTVILFEKGQVSKRLDATLGLGLNESKLKAWLEKLGSS